MQAYFVLWSVQRNELLWRVKCGGAHRVWDLALEQSVCVNFFFFYVIFILMGKVAVLTSLD